MTGQVNFYKAFSGVLNATDGTFINTFVFSSNTPTHAVGYSSSAIEMDLSGNIFAGIYFMNAAVNIVKF